MNIAVLVKQVPRTEKIKIDKKSGTLLRKGVESILNPYCEYAIDLALSIKKRMKNVKITVFTMGPESAETVLRRALSLGCNEAVLLCDRLFAGSDCWSTSLTLSRGINFYLGLPDLIICGKQAIDGDTAQVPAEISEMLSVPLLPYVVEIQDLSEKYIKVKSEMEDENLIFKCQFPAIITVSNGSNNRKMPSVSDVIRAYSYDIIKLDSKILNCDANQTGLKGSPTKVVKIEPVVLSGKCEFFNEENVDRGFDKIIEFIIKKNGDRI